MQAVGMSNNAVRDDGVRRRQEWKAWKRTELSWFIALTATVIFLIGYGVGESVCKKHVCDLKGIEKCLDQRKMTCWKDPPFGSWTRNGV